MASGNSAEAQSLYSAGNKLFQKGRLDEAIQQYSEAIRLDSSNFNAYFARGNCFKDLKKNTEAIADYQKAQELKPENSGVYVALGTVFDGLVGFTNICKAYFNMAIELEPSDAGAYVARGNFLAHKRQRAEALQTTKRQLAYNQMMRVLMPHGQASTIITIVIERITKQNLKEPYRTIVPALNSSRGTVRTSCDEASAIVHLRTMKEPFGILTKLWNCCQAKVSATSTAVTLTCGLETPIEHCKTVSKLSNSNQRRFLIVMDYFAPAAG